MDWNQYPDSLGGKSDNTTEGQKLKPERREPTYYARVPLMAQLELDPYELALYTNYKQTCAEFGECFKSNNTLAKETHMSATKVKEAKRSLALKGYIRIEYGTAPELNHSDPPTVTIVDVWDRNHALGESTRGGRCTPTPGRQASTNKNSTIRTKKKKDSVPSTDGQSSTDALDQTIAPVDTVTPTTERPRDLMWDIIAKEWTLPPARIGKMKKFLLGGFVKTGDKKHDSKYAAEIDNNIDYPMSHEELAGFVKWYRQRNPTISLPESPEALSTWVYRYREHAKAKTATPTQSPMIDMRELIGGGS